MTRPAPFFRVRPGLAGPLRDVWETYLRLDRDQWRTPAALEAEQRVALRDLIAHCVAHVPYYRRSLARLGPDPDLRQLPILTRREVSEHAAELRAERLPDGVTVTGTGRTSGTTGVPLAVPHTTRGQVWWHALHLRDLEWCGLDPTARVAAFRPMSPTDDAERGAFAAGIELPSWNPVIGRIVETGPGFLMDLRTDLGRQLDALRAVRPDAVIGYPSHLARLAEYVAASGWASTVRRVQTIAEQLTPAMRRAIERGFGATAFDLYSCVEAGYVASPCPAGQGLHVHAESVIVEVLDDAAEPCPPGVVGRVVLTPLHQHALPLLRYEIGDRAARADGPCPCGRGLPRLTHVEGKERPWLRLAGGETKNATYLASRLQAVPGLLQYQVTQHGDGWVTVVAVPGREWVMGSAAAVRAAVEELLEATDGYDVTIADDVPRTAGGKHRDFVVEERRPVVIDPRKTEGTAWEGEAPAEPEAPGSAGASPSQETAAASSIAVTGPRKTVLLAWELGGGLGHVGKLVALGRRLEADGHRVVLALRDAVEPSPLLRGVTWPVRPAPTWVRLPAAGEPAFRAASFADVLARHGYADPDVLGSLARGWDDILAEVQPDLIVADFAPTAVLVAAGRVPAVSVGCGFSTPPADGPTYPRLFHDGPAPDEASLLGVVNAACRCLGRPAVSTLPAAFAATPCVTTLPDLDPYRAVRCTPVVGPFEPLAGPLPPPAVPRFFAYLAADVASTEPALQLLARAKFTGEAFVRGATAELQHRLRAAGLAVHDRPPPLADALTRCHVVVHHGGSATAAAALAAGRPQLVFPRHLEQQLTAAALHALGVAHYLTDRFPAADVTEAMRQLLRDPMYAARATDAAGRQHRTGPWDGLGRSHAVCRNLLS